MAEDAFQGTVAGPRKRRLWTEMAVMASVLWLPGVWSSTHDFLRHTLPSRVWPSEIGAAIRAIAAIALVAFILVRGSESLQRFGFSKPSMKLVGWAIAALAVVAVIGLSD